VAVDFPKLKILLAHGGRPLWMKTAFFSAPPPSERLSGYQRYSAEIATDLFFHGLGEIAHKDRVWDGLAEPPVFGDVKRNLDEFNALSIPEEMKQQILSKTAASLWPE